MPISDFRLQLRRPRSDAEIFVPGTKSDHTSCAGDARVIKPTSEDELNAAVLIPNAEGAVLSGRKMVLPFWVQVLR